MPLRPSMVCCPGYQSVSRIPSVGNGRMFPIVHLFCMGICRNCPKPSHATFPKRNSLSSCQRFAHSTAHINGQRCSLHAGAEPDERKFSALASIAWIATRMGPQDFAYLQAKPKRSGSCRSMRRLLRPFDTCNKRARESEDCSIDKPGWKLATSSCGMAGSFQRVTSLRELYKRCAELLASLQQTTKRSSLPTVICRRSEPSWLSPVPGSDPSRK